MKDEKDVKQQDLQKRTKEFAIAVIRMVSQLPKTTEIQVIAKQLLRSGTSVGAQYAEAKRAKSNKDFITKIEGALQELEETIYWLDLLAEVEQSQKEKTTKLSSEADELIAIFVTIVKKVKTK